MDARLRGGLLALGAMLAAAGARAQALPEGVTPQMVAEGRKLFEGRGLCAGCHGRDARGLVGPNLTDGDWWHSDGTYPAIVQQITRGVSATAARSRTPMPPKGGASLSDAEVRAVAAYVYSLRAAANAGMPGDSGGTLARGAGRCPGRGAGHCAAHGAGRGMHGPCRT